MKKRTLTICVLALFALVVAGAAAEMTSEQARQFLSERGINPDTYTGGDGQKHVVTMTGGQIQWIWHQAGIEPSFDGASYRDKKMYIYNVTDVKTQYNVIDPESGYPALFSVISGPLTRTEMVAMTIGDKQVVIYQWHAVLSIGYPWVVLVEFSNPHEEINLVGGRYDITTIPSLV